MQVFPIVPAGARPLWILIPIAVLILGALAVLGAAIFSSNAARFEVSDAGVRLRGELYGRLVPAHQLRGDGVRVVDLTQTRELEPTFRRVGTALPGYRAGWFRLRNGERALLYVTDERRAVYVPTTAGWSLLVTPRDPEGFAAAVRRVARG